MDPCLRHGLSRPGSRQACAVRAHRTPVARSAGKPISDLICEWTAAVKRITRLSQGCISISLIAELPVPGVARARRAASVSSLGPCAGGDLRLGTAGRHRHRGDGCGSGAT